MAGGSNTKAVLTVGATLDKGSVGATFGKLRKEQDKLTASIADTKLEQKALRVQMRGLKKDSAELQTLDAKYKSLGDSIKRDELAVISLQRQQAKLAKAPTGESKWGKMRGMLGGAGQGLASLGRSAAMAGTAMVGLGVAGFHGLTRVAESMDQTIKTSRALGVSTDALQELRYAAEDSGMSAKSFDTAMQRMVRRIGQGSAEATGAMKTLGIRMDWIKKQSPEDQMRAIGEAMQGIEGQGERLAVLTKIFDTEGAKGMAVMLNDGAKGLAEMRAAARESGSIIPEDDLANAEMFTHEMQRLKTSAFGAIAPIAGELMPKVIETFRDGVDWIKGNRDGIREFGTTAASTIGDVFNFGKAVVGIIGNVAELTGGWGNLAKVAGAFWLAMKVGALSNPVTAALMGIGLAITALITHWDDLGRSFAYVWEQWLAPWLQGMRDKLQSMLDVLNKIPGINLSLPNVTRPLPATETGGGVAPAIAAAGAGGGTTVHQTNVNHFDGKIDRREAERLAREANRDAAERLQSGGLFSPAPGV